MKESLVSMATAVLGKKLSYRIGRAMYMRARGDLLNQMATNGETYMQKALARALSSLAKEVPIQIMDVGANVGEWTKSMMQALETASITNFAIHLFEPVPGTMEMLQNNLGAEKCLLFNEMALSSGQGNRKIHIVSDGAGTNSLHGDMLGDSTEIVSIKTTTVYDYFKNNRLEHIHYLKCDAEGHDAEVILGAKALLESGCISVLQFEYNYRWIAARHYLKDVFDLISGLDYKIGKICGDHLEIYSSWHYELEKYFEANWVVIKSHCLSWFDIHECVPSTGNVLAIGRP